MTPPSLPQNASTDQKAARAAELIAACKIYTVDTTSTIQPLPISSTIPSPAKPTLVWVDTAGAKAVELLGNLLIKFSKLTEGGLKQVMTEAVGEVEHDVAIAAIQELKDLHQDLSQTLTERPQLGTTHHGLFGRVKNIVEKVEEGVEGVLGKHPVESFIDKVIALIERLVKLLISDTLKTLLTYIGLNGTAKSMNDFEELFQSVRLPNIGSNYETDTIFAWMRVGGPNPMVIRRYTALNPEFPVSNTDYIAALQAQNVAIGNDSLETALHDGRLYLADYSSLAGVPLGTVDGRQKYLAAGYALFAVPQGGKRLLPIAIQLGPKAGNQNPIVRPGQGLPWELAKLQIQTADGNWHEAVSHLGQTHLVIEVIALALFRNLPPEHPLYVLLLPHVEGSLFINYAAVNSLIAPNGVVDKILSGTIEASTQLAVNSVIQYPFNARFVPVELAARQVQDTKLLPEYPYRDDALLIWQAIHNWVHSYLSVYYNNDEDVTGDYELQNWCREVCTSINSFGENGSIHTFDYLVNAITLIIFTGSAQHAAVNFPQNAIMSFAPAMPLAAYIPPNAGESKNDQLKQLPPLQNAVIQQAVGVLLGGVYYTRLGDYDRYRATPYFSDPRVQGALEGFDKELRAIERKIGISNLDRITYAQLLPSSIPQSINI